MPGATMNFERAAKAHLAIYRREYLRVTEDGVYRKKEYPHVLPECARDLNILEEFRSDFFKWYEESKVKLHNGFCNMNSSQAACFNLFFPPAKLKKNRILFSLLGINNDSVNEWAFEKVENTNEGTNFDFYVRCKSEKQIYVEFKYTENEFGSVTRNDRRLKKLESFYKPALKEKVALKYLDEFCFFAHYQVLRNLVYFCPTRGDRVVFMYPKNNARLGFLPKILDDIIPSKKIRDLVSVRYLEDAVNDALKAVDKKDDRLCRHFEQYRGKYLEFKCNNDVI